MPDEHRAPQQIDPAARTAASSRKPLSVGLNLPITEGALGGRTAGWSDLVALARRAEDLGFDSLWLPDHLLVTWQGRTHGIWECWSMLAALAAATSRIELGALVSCTSFRNPAVLAKMAATVDEISSGRLIVGLGAGWDGPEFRAFGIPSDHLVGRFEEALQIITPLLRTGKVDFEGRYYSARECEISPRGPRPNGPPILVGGKGPRVLRLAATYADSWNAEGPFQRPEETIPLRTAIDAACAAVGRDPGSLGRSASVVVNPASAGQDRDPAFAETVETLQGFARAGLDTVQLWLSPVSLGALEQFAPVLDHLRRGQPR